MFREERKDIAYNFIKNFQNFKSRIIFAHDFNIDEISSHLMGFSYFDNVKLSHRSIFGGYGPSVIDMIRQIENQQISTGKRETPRKIMIDMKLHDIPSSAAEMAKSIINFFKGDIQFLTIHASGGYKMMATCMTEINKFCKKKNFKRPKIIAVTVLTSMTSQVLRTIGVKSSDNIINERPAQVLRLASLAKEANCDGIVCSYQDVLNLTTWGQTDLLSKLIIMCPGIRFENDNHDDQNYIATPQQALNNDYIDYIIMGRSLLKRLEDFSKINKEK